MPVDITCVIDSLHSGGAQRQMVYLVNLLAEKNHSVTLLTYHRLNHFEPLIDKGRVQVVNVESSRFMRGFAIRRAIRKSNPQLVISYLTGPNLLSVLGTMPPRRIPLIVSERSLDIHGKTLANRFRYFIYRQASFIVANSQTQTDFIAKSYPGLSHSVRFIPNCIEIEKFQSRRGSCSESPTCRIIVVASVQPLKNAETLVKAVSIMRKAYGIDITVDWFGRCDMEQSYSKSIRALVGQCDLDDHFQFRGNVMDLSTTYAEYDALCLASHFEGCANAICEAMAAGLPIIASNVGDNRVLVTESSNGFLFDPKCEQSLVDALVRFANTDRAQRQSMGLNSRNYAETVLSPEKFIQSYTKLIRAAIGSTEE